MQALSTHVSPLCPLLLSRRPVELMLITSSAQLALPTHTRPAGRSATFGAMPSGCRQFVTIFATSHCGCPSSSSSWERTQPPLTLSMHDPTTRRGFLCMLHAFMPHALTSRARALHARDTRVPSRPPLHDRCCTTTNARASGCRRGALTLSDSNRLQRRPGEGGQPLGWFQLSSCAPLLEAEAEATAASMAANCMSNEAGCRKGRKSNRLSSGE